MQLLCLEDAIPSRIGKKIAHKAEHAHFAEYLADFVNRFSQDLVPLKDGDQFYKEKKMGVRVLQGEHQ